MATLIDLEKEIEQIKQRNKKVEADKAWEISWTRKLVILGVTYISVSLFLWVTNFDRPWEGAIVPTAAFLLANMTIPFFKNLWLEYIYNRFGKTQRF